MPVPDPVASSGPWRPWCTGLTASPQPAVKSAAARSAGTAANVVRLSMISPVVECAPRWVTPRVAHHEWQGSGQRATARRAGSTPRLHRTAASDRAGPPSFPAHPLSLKRPLTDKLHALLADPPRVEPRRAARGAAVHRMGLALRRSRA